MTPLTSIPGGKSIRVERELPDYPALSTELKLAVFEASVILDRLKASICGPYATSPNVAAAPAMCAEAIRLLRIVKGELP